MQYLRIGGAQILRHLGYQSIGPDGFCVRPRRLTVIRRYLQCRPSCLTIHLKIRLDIRS